MSTSPTSPSFRAIIVGGGPVGLCLANAFELAGIDYVLLERGPEVVVEMGAGIGIWPHSVRLLDQLGIHDEIMKSLVPLKGKRNIRPDGSVLSRSNMFEEIQACHGHPWTFVHRRDLLKALYGNLPDKERIKTNKAVNDIETHPNSVDVHCEDGSIEEGSIIVGADGVHSTIRRLMQEKALARGANHPDESRTMKATYQSLIGCAGPIETEGPEDNWEIRSNGMTLQVIPGLDQCRYFFLYRRLDTPTCERTRYTQEQADQFAEAYADFYFTPELKFGDLWKARKHATLVNLEEGVAKTWHWDRVVLMGDAAHKVTPNAGFGMNLGWQGVVELTNRVRSLLKTSPVPDTALLEGVFKQYQAARMKDVRFISPLSALYTRTVAWANLFFRINDEISRFINGDITITRYGLAPVVRNGIVLDFVEETRHKTGKMPWVHQRLQSPGAASLKESGDGKETKPVVNEVAVSS